MAYKLSASDGIGVAGLILTLVLVVLDKSGNLTGPVLSTLLALAAAITLCAAFSMSWVSDAASSRGRWMRRAVAIIAVLAIFSGIAAWTRAGWPAPKEKVATNSPSPISQLAVAAEGPAALPAQVSEHKKPRRPSAPKPQSAVAESGIHGSDNTVVGNTPITNLQGNGNTIVGATDAGGVRNKKSESPAGYCNGCVPSRFTQFRLDAGHWSSGPQNG